MRPDPNLPQPDDNYILPIEQQPEKNLPKFAQRRLSFGPYRGRQLGKVNVSHLVALLTMRDYTDMAYGLRFDVERTLRYKIRGAA
jgi:hypothetical protein